MSVPLRAYSFFRGEEDTLDLDGTLSMWRVGGVVYAVGLHPLAAFTHRNCIAAYRTYKELPHMEYVIHGFTVHRDGIGVRASLNGRHVGPDEVLTIHIEEIKCLEN